MEFKRRRLLDPDSEDDDRKPAASTPLVDTSHDLNAPAVPALLTLPREVKKKILECLHSPDCKVIEKGILVVWHISECDDCAWYGGKCRHCPVVENNSENDSDDGESDDDASECTECQRMLCPSCSVIHSEATCNLECADPDCCNIVCSGRDDDGVCHGCLTSDIDLEEDEAFEKATYCRDCRVYADCHGCSKEQSWCQYHFNLDPKIRSCCRLCDDMGAYRWGKGSDMEDASDMSDAQWGTEEYDREAYPIYHPSGLRRDQLSCTGDYWS